MEEIPNELIQLIFGFLSLPKDIANMSMTCHKTNNNIPDDQKRILGIMYLYSRATKYIKRARYYITDIDHVYKKSLRVDNDWHTVSYVNTDYDNVKVIYVRRRIFGHIKIIYEFIRQKLITYGKKCVSRMMKFISTYK